MDPIKEQVRKDLEKMGIAPRRFKFDNPLMDNLRRIAQARAEAEREIQNLPPDRAEKIRTDIHMAIREELPAMLQSERERLSGLLDAERKRLDRLDRVHRPEIDREILALDRKYKAMSLGELQDLARAVEGGKVRLRPEALDALSAELRPVDPQGHQELRKAIREKSLDDPARFTEAGEILVQQVAALDAAARHGWEVPVTDSYGNIVPMTVDAVLEDALES